MKTLIISLSSAALAGFLGMGLGYVSADGVPDTVTETKEVPGPVRTVTKEIEVPSPTKTVEVEVPGPTKTVTKEVKYIPAKIKTSCLFAMDRAEAVGDHAAEFADISAQYLPLIQEAYQAGVAMDSVDDIIAEMERLSSLNQDLNRRTGNTIDQYNRASSVCKAGMN